MEGGREQTPTPLREGCSVQNLGRRWGSSTLPEVLTSQWGFFCPCSGKRKVGFKRKTVSELTIGKKAELKQITHFDNFETFSSIFYLTQFLLV